MPQISGIDFLQRLELIKNKPGIILLSFYITEEEAIKIKSKFLLTFLTKLLRKFHLDYLKLILKTDNK
jgi:hypothetical protein